MDNARLLKQIELIIEIDRLKTVLRRSYLMDGSRLENSAEHSWHLAIAAMLLAEHANEPIDVLRVLKIALIHDLVEIDAGDTFLYDAVGTDDKATREAEAADRLFGLLPDDQRDEFRALWEEYESGVSPESRFAASLDRLLPLMHALRNKGRTWQEHGVVAAQVSARNAGIRNGSEAIGEFATAIIEEAVAQGYLPTE